MTIIKGFYYIFSCVDNAVFAVDAEEMKSISGFFIIFLQFPRLTFFNTVF